LNSILKPFITYLFPFFIICILRRVCFITSRVINLEDDNYKEADKKPSKTLKKEIYVKEVKGLKMVKKFFVWETNVQSDEYPRYIFYKVDYFPSRASKLNRDIKVSNDKKQILNIFKDSIESDIKKGWNKKSNSRNNRR
jgi:hypothetical protein